MRAVCVCMLAPGAQVVTPLLKVLHSLHQVGIIHRDIKPENIFFETDGTLRLGDFGLAINATRERPISKVGTLDYMAPEVRGRPLLINIRHMMQRTALLCRGSWCSRTRTVSCIKTHR